MVTRTAPPIVFKEGPDDFDFVMLRVRAPRAGAPGGIEVMLRQSPDGAGDPAEASDLLSDVPDGALRGISHKQLRAALDGIVTHLRGKAGIL